MQTEIESKWTETNATGLKKTENQLWPQKSETIFIEMNL